MSGKQDVPGRGKDTAMYNLPEMAALPEKFIALQKMTEKKSADVPLRKNDPGERLFPQLGKASRLALCP